MKSKYILFLILITCIVFIIVRLGQEKIEISQNELEKQLEQKNSLPTERFIQQYLLMDDGLIYTDFQQNEGGSLVLSESMGLWMKYLVEKEENDQFKKAFQTVKSHFLFDNYLIAWRIKDGEKADTNALIDDLRIVEALFIMGEKTAYEPYIQLAQKIADSIMKYNQKESFLVDFYDVKYEYANNQLTLLYLNINAFKYMEKYGIISTNDLAKLNKFMKNIPESNSFFPKYYDIEREKFHYEETVNLIDQLYMAIYSEQAEINTNFFFNWLKEAFYQNNRLYGRYDLETITHVVDYESAAVYALAIIYAVKKTDTQFAKDLYKQMITMRINDEQSSFYGSYMDESLEETHSFDNLLPLLAERILYNEQIIK